jgi:hypothetical protein
MGLLINFPLSSCGMADAENKGRNEAGLDIARNLKGMELSVSQIAEGTGLSPKTIALL